MNTNEISGKRQMEFLAEFDYIREAGTVGEEKAATIIQETLNSFGVENHLEEFCFETFQVKKAKLTITDGMNLFCMWRMLMRSASQMPEEKLLW